METFTVTHGERHPTDLAGLRGARLVAAQETEEGRRWNENKIKALTGGDPISARFMRQDYFTFYPAFKLITAGNHKPGLRGIDEAIRRRLNLAPFTVTIPKNERDKDLFEKLRAEWPGILQWMMEGCTDWLEIGLKPPPVVVAATEDYLNEEDALARWIEECCAIDPIYYDTVANLFPNWRVWAENAREFVGSQKRFSQALDDRGYQRQRESGTGRAGFKGIALKRFP
jgi:putative DNA primase/helicase